MATFDDASEWWRDYETVVGLPVVLVSGGPQCVIVSYKHDFNCEDVECRRGVHDVHRLSVHKTASILCTARRPGARFWIGVSMAPSLGPDVRAPHSAIPSLHVREQRRGNDSPIITVQYRSRYWQTPQHFTVDARAMGLL